MPRFFCGRRSLASERLIAAKLGHGKRRPLKSIWFEIPTTLPPSKRISMSTTGIVNSKSMRRTALAYDMVMAGLAMYAALILRLGTFEGFDNYSLVGPFNGLDDNNLIFGAILPFIAAAGVSLLILGTYRTSWRHASITDLTNIVKAATLAVLIYISPIMTLAACVCLALFRSFCTGRSSRSGRSTASAARSTPTSPDD